MSSYEARLRLGDESAPPLTVEVDVTDDRIRLHTDQVEIADWDLHDIRVSALEDGFHIRAEGEVVVLDVDDDARFAVDLGLRSAHPALRRRMAQILRDHEIAPG